LYNLLAYSPNKYMNAFTFWELMNTYLDLWGNSYAYISRYGGKVAALTPIDPTKVVPMVENGRFFYRVKDTRDQVLDGDKSPDKLLHFKDISFDGLVGISRIAYAERAISLGISAEKFSKEFFDKGGHSKGVIEMEGQMSDDAYQTFKKRWDQNANHGTPLLDLGKKYKQLTMPIEDAMFISARQFQLQDIARIFRVPPHLLADLSRATFSNIEHSDIQFVKYSLRPMVKRYEHELETKLLGDQLGKKNIRFNLDGILRGDTATRGEYLSKMVSSQIMMQNEARAMENLNPVEGGDQFLAPFTTPGKNNSDEKT
jgi:HK97 family phage portal protein